MKIFTMPIYISVMTYALAGCGDRARATQVSQIPDLDVSIIRNSKTTPEPITQAKINPGDNKTIENGGSIIVALSEQGKTNNAFLNPIFKVELQISNDDNASSFDTPGKYSTHELDIDFRGGSGYSFDMKKIEKKYGEVPNNHWIKVKSTVDSLDMYIQRKAPDFTYFSAFSAPILYRLHGSAGSYTYQNFAPSLGINVVQYNIDNDRFPFISTNFITSSFQNPDNKTYGLALGDEIDFGGWLQVGVVHDFNSKMYFMVVGLRPEILGKFIFK